MSRDRLDRFVNALESELVQLVGEPALDLCTPRELITMVLGCVVRSRETCDVGPEGTRVVIGQGHTRIGQAGKVVGVEPVNGLDCYRIQLDSGTSVLVPPSMCLPIDTPAQRGKTVETVAQLYSRSAAEAAASQEIST